MSEMKMSEEYVVSDRVTLRRGDLFRATGGPYYVKRDERGNKVRMSMAARGPFRFIRFCEQGRHQWIEAISMREQSSAVLSLTKRQSIMPGSLIARPYVVLGKVGGKRAARLEERAVGRGRRRRADAPGGGPVDAPGGRRRRRAADAPGGPVDAPAADRRRRGAAAVAAVLASLKPIDPSGR